ncbi:protein TFG-like isoform X1 [Lytechinus variegatus]|uniref:protein TFG-like isoform X1 n=1 Tax=Lytechinus variegatus TaxID=7654 RepID=UPI001BB22615|nr:protein TFG-like isoform X1 [Lytechinus variegatus]
MEGPSGSFPQIDLSNKLIIKAQLGDDIRRIPIHNEDITYDELVLMMQRVYRGKLNPSDEVVIKYKDEDGDLITIFDSTDLSFAIQCSRILKITLFVNGQPRPIESDQVKNLRRELQSIRNQVNFLLDSLEPRLPIEKPEENAAEEQAEAKPAVSTAQTAMFDPYKQPAPNAAVMNSFGIDKDEATERPASPADSVSSRSSNVSQQQQQQQQQRQQPPANQPGAPHPQPGAPGVTQGMSPVHSPRPGPQQPGMPQSQQQQQAYAPRPSSQPTTPGLYGAPTPTSLGYQPGNMPQPQQQQQQPAVSQGYNQPQAPYSGQQEQPQPQQPQGFPQQQQQGYPPQPQQPGYNPQQQQQQQQPAAYSAYQQQPGQQPGGQQPYPTPAGGPGNPYARNTPYGRPGAYQQPGLGYK